MKISHRLMLAMAGLALCLTGILWFYQAFLLEDQYWSHQEVRLKEEVIGFAADQATDPESAKAKAYQAGISLEWYDGSGNMIYASEGEGMDQKPVRGMGRMNWVGSRLLLGDSAMATETVAQLKEKGEVLVKAPISRFGTDVLVYARRLEDKSTLIGSLSVAPIDSAISVMQGQLLGVALLIFVVALIFSVVLSVTFTRPIRDMEQAVLRIAKGDFGVRVDTFEPKGQGTRENSPDELVQLALGINKMAASLSQLDALRNELVANVSHELRTPLGIIRGYAEMLQDISGSDPVLRQKHIGLILDETQRLGEMVATLLDLSQLQAGSAHLHCEPIDVVSLLQTTTQKYEAQAVTKQINFHFRADVPGYTTSIDGQRLVQIIDNFIGNAFRYTPSGGTIEVRLDEKGKLYVSDTGAGIAKGDLENIWERYYRVQSQGTGLGLAIAKALCEQMGVGYGVTSTLGQGTTFFLVFKKEN